MVYAFVRPGVCFGHLWHDQVKVHFELPDNPVATSAPASATEPLTLGSHLCDGSRRHRLQFRPSSRFFMLSEEEEVALFWRFLKSLLHKCTHLGAQHTWIRVIRVLPVQVQWILNLFNETGCSIAKTMMLCHRLTYHSFSRWLLPTPRPRPHLWTQSLGKHQQSEGELESEISEKISEKKKLLLNASKPFPPVRRDTWRPHGSPFTSYRLLTVASHHCGLRRSCDAQCNTQCNTPSSSRKLRKELCLRRRNSFRKTSKRNLFLNLHLPKLQELGLELNQAPGSSPDTDFVLPCLGCLQTLIRTYCSSVSNLSSPILENQKEPQYAYII